MLEGLWDLHSALVNQFSGQLILIHEFGISLQDIDMTCYCCSNVGIHLSCLCWSTLAFLLNNCLSSLHLTFVIIYVTFEFINTVLCHGV